MDRRSKPLAALQAAAVVGVLLAPSLARAQEAGDTLFQRYQAVESILPHAAKAMDARRFEEARTLLGPVLSQVPDHAGAHFLLATMAYETRDFAGALDHIETSERGLKRLDSHYAKLLADMHAKDEAEARDVQASMDRLRSMDADGMTDLMSTDQARLNYLKEKDGELSKGATPFAVPSVYSFLHGNCLYRLGRFPEAGAQYQAAVRSDPSNTKAWNNLINLYREEKDFDQARAALAKAEAAGQTIQPKLKQRVLEGR